MNVELDASMAEILPIFLAEASDSIEVMEAAILRLEQDATHRESIDEVFRVVHTLKGDSGSLGFEKLAQFSHLLESGLDRLRDGRVLDGVILELLLNAVDELRLALVAAGKQRDRLTASQRKLQTNLRKWMKSVDKGAKQSSADRADGKARGTATKMPGPTIEDTDAIERSSNRYLRVDVEKLDQLLTLAGEVAVARSALGDALEAGHGSQTLFAIHQSADRLNFELQELVMRVRMVPVGPAFRRHQRLVRDLSQRLGKEVVFTMSGGEVEIDSSVLQLLQDPLSHMLRNAIHHGIEVPEERVASNKPPQGCISLNTWQEGSSIWIELRDDGRGIERDKVRRRAQQMNLLAADVQIDDEQLLQLLFEPGFSTSEAVTDVSGRGVGMDVVRRNLESLRSAIEIESEEGQYTSIRIQVPLTLAVVDGLVVRCGNDQYIAPTESIVELVDLNGADCKEQNGILNLRGEAVAARRLSELLVSPSTDRDCDSETVIVVRHGSSRMGLIVDGIQGKTQVVIKPLPNALSGVSALAGTSVLGSGRVAFLLDIHNLMRGTAKSSGAARPN